jgi:hypothetical protein
MIKQHTKIQMQPISDSEAREIGHDLSSIGVDDRDRCNLIMLICGIAAINNPVERQEVAETAVHAIYLNLYELFDEVAAYVARIYAESIKEGAR